MKKMILSLAVLSALTSPAHAFQGQCIPTQTVEEAKVIYDNGLAELHTRLQLQYQNAQTELQAHYDSARTKYQDTVQSAEETYQQEITQIRTDLNPGWKLEIEAATARHNAVLAAASQEYNDFCNEAALNYGNTTELARLNFNHQAQELAETYNRSVCATP